MLNSLIRKIYFKGLNPENRYTAELALDSFKMTFFADIILFSVLALPLAAAMTFFTTNIKYLSLCEIIIDIILLLISFAGVFIFIRIFFYEILLFRKSISINLYSRKLTEGKALTIEDFEILKKENESIFNAITNFKSSGFCYHICFELLKTLKKGTFWFVATKWANQNEEKSKSYTMHALYENNDWCYDTYSMKQHPFEFALEHFGAKKYLCFSYEDIKDLTFYEFREKTASKLKAWCIENDCYEEWSDFSQT